MSTDPVYRCPACGREFDHPVQYCSQCGAPNDAAMRKQQIETILHGGETPPVSGAAFTPVPPAPPAVFAGDGSAVFPSESPAAAVLQDLDGNSPQTDFGGTTPSGTGVPSAKRRLPKKGWWIAGGVALLTVIAIVIGVVISGPHSSPKRLANEFIRLYEKGDFASIYDLVDPKVLETKGIQKSDLPSDAWTTGEETSVGRLHNLRYVDALVGADKKIAVCLLEYDLRSSLTGFDPTSATSPSVTFFQFIRQNGKWYLGSDVLYMLG